MFVGSRGTDTADYAASAAPCCTDPRSGAALRRERAKLWIEGAGAPLSFQFVCEMLGFDVELARRALLDADPAALVTLATLLHAA